jgi:hypothetical protein
MHAALTMFFAALEFLSDTMMPTQPQITIDSPRATKDDKMRYPSSGLKQQAGAVVCTTMCMSHAHASKT